MRRRGWQGFIRSYSPWMFTTNCSKAKAQTGMDAQAMLGFIKVKGIDGRKEHLEILRIVEKTHVIFDFQERGEMPG